MFLTPSFGKFLVGLIPLALGLTLSCSRARVISVVAFGAVGDGISDDTSHLQAAIDRSPEGSTIEFGNTQRAYLITKTLQLRPRRNYVGHAHLMMSKTAAPGAPMFSLLYGHSRDVRIDGLNFDANGVGAILVISVGGSNVIPARNISIENTTFANTRGSGEPWESAIYAPAGLEASIIANNHFQRCGGGCLYLVNPNHLVVSGNDFDESTLTAVSIALYPLPFKSGDAVEISRNTGRRLKRGAIHLWSATSDLLLSSPVIQGNNFKGWKVSPSVHDEVAIAMVGSKGAKVLDNTITDGAEGYGIQAGAGSVIQGNTVEGFSVGIIVQGQRDVTISRNHLVSQSTAGVFVSNAGSNRHLRVLNNQIDNAKDFGIGSSPNDYGGAEISGNTILRNGGSYPDDSKRVDPFVGIKLDAGLQRPITLLGNTITQTAVHPPTSFGFWGIGIFGGFPGSKISNNTIESKSSAPLGMGLRVWTNGLLDGTTVANNRFVNLDHGI